MRNLRQANMVVEISPPVAEEMTCFIISGVNMSLRLALLTTIIYFGYG